MKTGSYFTLSINHMNTPIGIGIRMNHGFKGYGLYIAIIQVLAQSKERIRPISEIPQIAYLLNIGEEEIREIVDRYFQKQDDYFWNDELEECMKPYDKKVAALNPSAGGTAAAANMTAEERILRAKKANAARLANQHKPTPTIPTPTQPNQTVHTPTQPNQTDTNPDIPNQIVPNPTDTQPILTQHNITPDSKHQASNSKQVLTDSVSGLDSPLPKGMTLNDIGGIQNLRKIK